jgi:hypothetical protein
VESASLIEWGSKEENEKHYLPILNLNKQLLQADGVMIRLKQLPEFERVMTTFNVFLKVPGEQVRRESLKVVQQYLIRLFE